MHGPDRTLRQERSIAGAARRLVERGVAATAHTADHRTVVYFRAPDEPARAPLELNVGPDGVFGVGRWARNQEQLLPAIERLPRDQRRLILLQCVDGYSMDEIAEVFGMSAQEAELLRQRAVAKIRTAVFAAAADRE